MISEEKHKIIVSHLRKSREYGKHILKVVPDAGSAIIIHVFELETRISEREKLISTIKILPVVRLYKKDTLGDDPSWITEEKLEDYE